MRCTPSDHQAGERHDKGNCGFARGNCQCGLSNRELAAETRLGQFRVLRVGLVEKLSSTGRAPRPLVKPIQAADRGQAAGTLWPWQANPWLSHQVIRLDFAAGAYASSAGSNERQLALFPWNEVKIDGFRIQLRKPRRDMRCNHVGS
jgi:hypothetical protein